jgi:2-polyprenyl-6-methoxyphenol hydroxylase-like FAD-dependent oxidoreductase
MARRVLIVGAGPTGLVLALWLKRLGIAVRIIDRAPAPGTTSRAMVVHARTLEFYDALGIADATIAAGEKGLVLNGHLYGSLLARIPFGDFGEGLSPYPFMLVLPQDVHERLLQDELRKCGTEVEQSCELVRFEEHADGVRATLRTSAGEETVHADYLCGCDGARSTVREQLGTAFSGGTYKQVFYVADAEIAGAMADDEVHFALSEYEILGVFPLKHRRGWRLIGIVPQEIRKDIQQITYDDVADQIRRVGRLTASKVNWFSSYHVHHRVADSFREGCVFLLGDAAHIHSPAGGQGMNTGIGDAANLAWKLAAILQHRAAPALLDSYPAERIAAARRIVASTDRIFSFQVSPSWSMRAARRWITPLMPALMRWRGVQHFMFRTISQIAFEYRESPISVGSAGRVYAGDRLPWVKFADGSDNFAPLRHLDWQVHAYGAAANEVETFCAESRLALHVYPWSKGVAAAGPERDALYLIRPDGHIAFAGKRDAIEAMRAYVARWEIRPITSLT